MTATLDRQVESLTHGDDLPRLVVAHHDRVHGGSARWCDQEMCRIAYYASPQPTEEEVFLREQEIGDQGWQEGQQEGYDTGYLDGLRDGKADAEDLMPGDRSEYY